jgi:large subunit ribosomal protein L6
MSRIGKQPVVLPDGVTATIDGQHVEVKGPKGTLSYDVHESIAVKQDGNTLVLEKKLESNLVQALFGTSRARVQNLVTGVSEGYKKELQMVGVGYRSQVQGNTLVVNAGYSNPVEMSIPSGIEVAVEKNTQLSVSGIDKQLVGQFAANVRAIRKPEPYLGKGIRYVDEYVRRKEGKTAK